MLDQSLKSLLTDAIYLAAIVYLGGTHAIGEAYLILLLFAFVQSRYGVGLMKTATALVTSSTGGGNPPPSSGNLTSISNPRMPAVTSESPTRKVPPTDPRTLKQTFLGWFQPNPVWILLVVACVLLYTVSFAKSLQ